MAFEGQLPSILESNPGSPPLSPSPTSSLPHAATTSPSPQRIPSEVLHGATKSASTPVSPTLHSRTATPPPASASTSAIAVPSPNDHGSARHRVQARPLRVPNLARVPHLHHLRSSARYSPLRLPPQKPSRTPTPCTRDCGTEYTSRRATAPYDTPPARVPTCITADVDTVVDRDAMRAPPSGGEDGAAVDEEPPVYTASEKAAGARSRVVSVSANTSTAQVYERG